MKFQPIQSHYLLYRRYSAMLGVVQRQIDLDRSPSPELIAARDSLKAGAERHLRALVVPGHDQFYPAR